MAFVRVLITVAAIVAAAFALAPASAETTDAISLQPGRNVLTWNGSAPYPIANFAETPVTQIHRWDAVRQEWLSHFIGQDGATLPELHLLPRVQYLLATEAEYELGVPNPLAEINLHAELRLADVPGDPLRFEAYWPNEDSPLEDLILLRPDDERLSVRAEVAGGVGEIEVYWVLDGRLNHQGQESDDVELLPGKHDDARLYAVDALGQVVSVELPRVVKLPQVEMPEMVYGVNAWSLSAPIGSQSWGMYGSRDEYLAVIQMIADIGFEYVRLWIPTDLVFYGWGDSLQHLDWLFQSIHEAGLQALPVVGPYGPRRLLSSDVSIDRGVLFNGQAVGDVNHAEALGRIAGRRWQSVAFFEVSNEPNIKQYRTDLDPIKEVEQQRAVALGILYENPNAIIVAGTPCCFWLDKWDGGIHGLIFLEAMYDAGFGSWYDILGIHLSVEAADFNSEVDRTRRLMTRYGDGAKPLWATETPAHWQSEEQYTEFLVDYLRRATKRNDLNGVLIWKIRDFPFSYFPDVAPVEHRTGIVAAEYSNGQLTLQPSGIAVRDFLRAQRKKQAANE